MSAGAIVFLVGLVGGLGAIAIGNTTIGFWALVGGTVVAALLSSARGRGSSEQVVEGVDEGASNARPPTPVSSDQRQGERPARQQEGRARVDNQRSDEEFDPWHVEAVRCPTVVNVRLGEIAYYVPPRGGISGLFGRGEKIFVGPLERVVLERPGTLYVILDAGTKKSVRMRTEVSVKSLSPEMFQAVLDSSSKVKGLRGIYQEEAVRTLEAIEAQLTALGTTAEMSREMLLSLVTPVTIEIKAALQIAPHKFPEHLEDFLEGLGVAEFGETVEDNARRVIFNIVEEAALSATAKMDVSVVDLAQRRRLEFQHAFEEELDARLAQYALDASDVSVSDITFEEDLQNYMDEIVQQMQKAASEANRIRLELQTREQQVLQQTKLALIEAQGQAAAVGERAHADREQITEIAAALRAAGVTDQHLIADVIRTFVLRDIPAGGLMISTGGGADSQPMQLLTLLVQSMTQQLSAVSEAVGVLPSRVLVPGRDGWPGRRG